MKLRVRFTFIPMDAQLFQYHLLQGKNYPFSTELPSHFCQMVLFVQVCFWRFYAVLSVYAFFSAYTYFFLPLPHCLDYCISFIVSLKIGYCESFNFILLSELFWHSVNTSFAFPYKFQNQLIYIYKKLSWIFIKIALNQQIHLEKIIFMFSFIIFNLLIHPYYMSVHLFRPSLISFISILQFSAW